MAPESIWTVCAHKRPLMWDPGGPPERSRARHRRAAAAARHHSQVLFKGRPLSSVRLRRDVIVATTSQTLEK